ncbi:MAG: glycosyltransferase family 39 protein, partial [Candidatus Micrarchaeaceae archaeon]
MTDIKRNRRIEEKHTYAFYYALLFSIIAFGAVLAMLLYAGPNFEYDDNFYISSAHLLVQGNPFFILSKYSYGFLKTVILALSFKAFGYGSIQAVLPNFLYFIITICLVFLIGKNIRGYGLGLVSAFMAAGMPFFVENATRVLADVPLGMVVALFFYLLFKYMAESKKSAVIALAVGLSAALPIFMKTEGFMIIFAEALSVLLLYAYEKHTATTKKRHGYGINKNFIMYAVVGLAIGLSVYFFVFYILTGNP